LRFEADISFYVCKSIKKMASDKNHRPCLPLKPQEKLYSIPANIISEIIIDLKPCDTLVNKLLRFRTVFNG
jgi:hypothetical protein